MPGCIRKSSLCSEKGYCNVLKSEITTLQSSCVVLELVRQKSKEKQSRNLRVKCLSDGELSMERKEFSCGAGSASRCYK